MRQPSKVVPNPGKPRGSLSEKIPSLTKHVASVIHLPSMPPTSRSQFLSVLAFWTMSALANANQHPTPNAPSAVLPQKHRAILEEHCSNCHNAEKQKGKFRIDDLPEAIADNRSAERWQKILNAINSGEMPPEDEKQLPPAAKADLLDDLAQTIVAARRNLGDSRGVTTMRRLNQREYGNSLHHLLGVRINVNELPADTSSNSFDTAGSNLFMSGDQFEQYLELAREALSEAFERHDNANTEKKSRFEAENGLLERVAKTLKERIDGRRSYMRWKRAVDLAIAKPENKDAAQAIRAEKKEDPNHIYRFWSKLEGAPSPADYGFTDTQAAFHVGLGQWNLVPYQSWFLAQPENRTGGWLSVGDNSVNSYFSFHVYGWPAGDYVVRIRLAGNDKADPQRRFIEFGMGNGNPKHHDSAHMVTGTLAAPQTIEIPVTLNAKGGRSFFVRERGTQDDDSQPVRKQGAGISENTVGPDFAIWLDWAEIERLPAKPASPGMVALQKIIGDPRSTPQPGELREAFHVFCAETYRGAQPSEEFVNRLVHVYDDHRKSGTDHRTSLKEALALALASPRFLYLNEPQPADHTATENTASQRLIPPRELAVRLSFLLWGQPPDRELLSLATSGELAKREVLQQQTDRLLNDPKADGFVHPFLHQWLRMDRLDFFRFNTARYPDFDLSTKDAARSEVYATFAHLLRNNLSVRELLKSRHIVVNGLLANYYGIEGVSGDSFQPVELPADSPRGGLLGMAAIHAMGSNGEHSSPVERGAWVLRKLLNEPPPPAPANVPQLTRLEDKLITTRERLQLHQEQPQCASCHRRIDPIGFGLENFDATGRWRTEDAYERAGLGKKTWQIDPAGTLHQGPSFASFTELRDHIHSRADRFAKGLSTALVEYALGHPAGFSDEPLIEQMVSDASQHNLSLRSFIHSLVQSRSFQTK